MGGMSKVLPIFELELTRRHYSSLGMHIDLDRLASQGMVFTIFILAIRNDITLAHDNAKWSDNTAAQSISEPIASFVSKRG